MLPIKTKTKSGNAMDLFFFCQKGKVNRRGVQSICMNHRISEDQIKGLLRLLLSPRSFYFIQCFINCYPRPANSIQMPVRTERSTAPCCQCYSALADEGLYFVLILGGQFLFPATRFAACQSTLTSEDQPSNTVSLSPFSICLSHLLLLISLCRLCGSGREFRLWIHLPGTTNQ